MVASHVWARDLIGLVSSRYHGVNVCLLVQRLKFFRLFIGRPVNVRPISRLGTVLASGRTRVGRALDLESVRPGC